MQSQVPSSKTVAAPLPQDDPPTVPAPKGPRTIASTVQQITQPENAQQPTKRQTTIITEYFEPPSPTAPTVRSVKPQDIPLPRSRAPTITLPSATAPSQGTASAPVRHKLPHDIPLPNSCAPTTTATPALPAAIPLPSSQPAAPTVYEGSPDLLSPKTDKSGVSHRSGRTRATAPTPMPALGQIPLYTFKNMPSVSVIDYAMAAPLPESRGTTMFGSPKAATRLTVSPFLFFFCSR